MILTSLALLAPALSQAQMVQGSASASKPVDRTAMSSTSESGTCAQFGGSFCVPFDDSYLVVPINPNGGPCHRNDDGSALLSLNGWSFDFFGTPWNDIFVNNNGNVSFGTPYVTYSSSGFPVAGYPMIAPFWADVDTRGGNGVDGAVWYREWSTAAGDAVNRIVLVWDNVGYYSAQTDKLNTFQLILTDGQDPLLGVGNNVCFCYDDMQWTTGSASSGSGGFGGVPATVGANQGNGIDSFVVGRFDQPGTAYDGPGGANDGVDYLDGQQIIFSVASNQTNVPPVFVNTPTSYFVNAGSSLTFDVEAIGPETNQSVVITNDAFGLPNFSTQDTPGNPAVSIVTFTPDTTQLGTHEIRFTATDNGSPTASADLIVTIFVTPNGSIGTNLCDPNAANSTGLPGQMWVTGSDVALANSMTLMVADLPANAFGYMVVSQSTGFLPMPGGSQGNLCLNGADIGRYVNSPMLVSADGVGMQAIDLTQIPHPSLGSIAAIAGQTFGWQLWYRDLNPTLTSNWTNAVRVTFQ